MQVLFFFYSFEKYTCSSLLYQPSNIQSMLSIQVNSSYNIIPKSVTMQHHDLGNIITETAFRHPVSEIKLTEIKSNALVSSFFALFEIEVGAGFG